MIHLKDKETKDINLKISTSSYEFLNYAYLTCRAFINTRTDDESFTKGKFMDDILICSLHNEPLAYVCNNNRLELMEAYEVAQSIIHIVSYETFSFCEVVENEIRALEICLKSKEERALFNKKELEDFIDDNELEHYQVLACDYLLKTHKTDLNVEDMIYSYFAFLIRAKIIIANENEDYKENVYFNHVKTAKKFLAKNKPAITMLIKYVIHQLYKTDELEIGKYGNKDNYEIFENYLKSLVFLQL